MSDDRNELNEMVRRVLAGERLPGEPAPPAPEPPKRERKLDTPRVAAAAEPDWSGWERWADAKIAAAIADHHEMVIEIVGGALKELLGEVDADFDQMFQRLDALQATVGALQRHHDQQSTLDLPPLPRNRAVN